MSRPISGVSALTTVKLAQLDGSCGPRHRFFAHVVEKLPFTKSLDCVGRTCAHVVLKDSADTSIVLQVFEEDEVSVYKQLHIGQEYIWMGCVVVYRHQQHPWLQRQDPEARTACAMHISNLTMVQFTSGSTFEATTYPIDSVNLASATTTSTASKCTERYHNVTPRQCVRCNDAYFGGKQLLCHSCLCHAIYDPPNYATWILTILRKHTPCHFDADNIAFKANIHALIELLLQHNLATPASNSTDPIVLATYTRYIAPLVFEQGFFDPVKQTVIVEALVAHLANSPIPLSPHPPAPSGGGTFDTEKTKTK